MGRHVPALLVLVAAVAAWEGALRSGLVSERVLPSLGDVFSAVPEVMTDASSRFWFHLGVTASEVGIGYGIAVVAGISLGGLVASSTLLRRVLYPLLVAFEVVPKVALVPLIILGLGYGVTSKAAVAALLAFFPLFLNTLQGFSSADPKSLDLMRSLRANPLQRFRLYLVPQALPEIFSGLKIALTLAFIGAIVAELLTLQSGLGFLINAFKHQLRMDMAFAATLIVALISTSLFLSMEWLERKLIFWTSPTTLFSD